MIKILPQKDSTYCLFIKIDFSQDNVMTDFFRFKMSVKKTINAKLRYMETKLHPSPIIVDC